MKELSKTYEPKEVEGRIYELWESTGAFRGHRDPDKKPFTIVMPPPNVTGQLHMGHAMDETWQDILIRYKRMKGFAALWVPGTDHAGIATQIKVEEALRSEGLTRYDLGRDAFVQRVWDWKREFGGRIVNQLKKLGASCDWERERFTLDEGCSKAVREVFISMYDKGLIYRGSRIVNWCPHCTTALSDAEVEYKDRPGKLWYIRYPVKGGGHVVIATTRPETMLGDTGVAVHPDDERYKDLVGRTCILPLVGREIPIVADEYCEMGFGTGAVKMTPAHDPNDFEVGQRHHLEIVRILDDNGNIIEGGKYTGMDRYEARKLIVADLEELGLLEKIEENRHNVGVCYRCGTDIEPLISAQWFVKMQPLAEEAIRVVEDGETKFVPKRFDKIYTNWMENVHDWCISRQLWWGHRIPAYYCDKCGEVIVAGERPHECPRCGCATLRQDEDVLDTWFSSALWPFSTLGWPDKTPDMDYFYPTDVLVTAYDIIFFWVARMIFSGCEHTKRPPFHTVLIHGLIRDEKGRKMSKSLGNGIDPLDIIDRYGCDALRFNLITGNSPGNDMRFFSERCEAMRNFANKVWNASRFVLMNLTIDKIELPETLALEDRWLLSKLSGVIREVNENMDDYELGIAAQKISDFIWDSYCDWYIELTKPRLTGGDESESLAAQKVLLFALSEILKLLHPFMPFITEEIWHSLPHGESLLMLQSFPEFSSALSFPEEEQEFEILTAAIKAVRSRRSELNVPPSKRARILVVSDRPQLFERGATYMTKLAYAESIEVIAEAPENPAGFVSVVTDAARLFIPLAELLDMEKELARLQKELEKARAEKLGQEKKLANESFLAKAPEKVVTAERERLEKAIALIANLEESVKQMGEIGDR
ncbi:MAG: valine--tRNA ligase [Oscillospiraceae bacterium]|jgi:valyl-tRNA synthetase|nr:valine--tRNA ligase [Oscillospiraceae bacterium]